MNPTETKTYFQLFSKVLLAALCLIALAATGCQSSNQSAKTAAQANDKKSTQSEPAAGQNNPPATAPNASESGGELPRLASTVATEQYSNGPKTSLQPTTTDMSGMIVGVWRYTTQYNGYPCQGEDIYQPNGQYSAMLVCGSISTQQTGVYYFLQPGVIRRDIKDYAPKVFQGVPVRMIAGETFQVGFLDNNRMVYGNDMVLYRAG